MGALGAEWSPGFGLTLRGSVMGNKAERPFLCAAGMGIGWSYEFFEVDAGYLHYLSAENHRGNTPITEFSADDIINLDQHPFSRNRLALTAKASLACKTSLARIEACDVGGCASHEVLPTNRSDRQGAEISSQHPCQSELLCGLPWMRR
jgi:hypothetical protein